MKDPIIHNKAWVAPGAIIRGNVTLDQGSSVWYNAVVRAECESITVGKNSNVQDCAVLHVDKDFPINIGENVTVGHGAVLHGCTVEDEALIGMGAIILNGAVIGAGSIVGAGALVTAGTVIPENSVAVGSPAKVIREVTAEQRDANIKNAKHYVEQIELYSKMEDKE